VHLSVRAGSRHSWDASQDKPRFPVGSERCHRAKCLGDGQPCRGCHWPRPSFGRERCLASGQAGRVPAAVGELAIPAGGHRPRCGTGYPGPHDPSPNRGRQFPQPRERTRIHEPSERPSVSLQPSFPAPACFPDLNAKGADVPARNPRGKALYMQRPTTEARNPWGPSPRQHWPPPGWPRSSWLAVLPVRPGRDRAQTPAATLGIWTSAEKIRHPQAPRCQRLPHPPHSSPTIARALWRLRR
jgi:hypothetical protein